MLHLPAGPKRTPLSHRHPETIEPTAAAFRLVFPPLIQDDVASQPSAPDYNAMEKFRKSSSLVAIQERPDEIIY